MNKTTTKVFSGAAGAGLVLAIVVAVNALLANVRVSKDLTEEKLYTLSEGTAGMLRDLERPVTLKFYFSRSHAQLPVALKNYAQRTTDFLREIESRSGGNLTLELLDPRPDTETEEWAQRYGLMPQAVGGIGAPPDLYLGLVAVSGTREASIPLLAPALEPQMEYLVARLIQEVTQERRPRIGVMSGLPVLGTPRFGPPPVRPDWLFVSELKAQYEVVPVAMDAAEIPEDIDALILAHPAGIGDETLFGIDQYVLGGGRLIAFVDPLCLSQEESGEPGMPALSSDLNRLTGAWGVRVDAGRVVADLAAATPVNLGEGRSELLPAWLTLRGEPHLNPDELATGSLGSLMLPFAGRIEGTPVEGLKMDVLVHASDQAVTLARHQAQNPFSQSTRDGVASAGAPLAVRLAGRFPTAFPDGPPKSGGDGDEDAAESGEEGGAGDWRKEAERDGVVVLVADADMLADRMAAQTVHFFGQVFHQPINDNLNFTMNLAEQLSGNPALIGLRSRGQFHRPFERVLAMEQAAQERWQEEEEKLQAKLTEAQQRLNELQMAKSEDQQLVLSPAQRAEIERFRQDRFETQRQLTEVRRNLRRSIERLGLVLKVLNMAAVPVLVAVFGLVHGWKRRQRAAA